MEFLPKGLEDVAISPKGTLGEQGHLLSQPGVLARPDIRLLFDGFQASYWTAEPQLPQL